MLETFGAYRGPVRSWILLGALVAATSVAFEFLRLPTPLLFGGLVGALIYALARPLSPLSLPSPWFTAGQAVVGVIVGSVIDWEALGGLGADWLIVVAVSLFSVVISILAGRLLLRHGISPATATFSSVAGGAAGLTALADDLGADARVVAVLQYLRLLVVLVTLPIVVTLVLGATGTGTDFSAATDDLWTGLLYTGIAIAGGLFLGRITHLPSAPILGPLIVASLLSLVPLFESVTVNPVIVGAGYLAIGIQVGLKFTVASLRSIGAMIPTALVAIAITLVSCAGLAWVLTATAGVSGADAYLATNPGGVYAVLGMSESIGGDVGFVTAAQILRTVIILGSAPFLAVYLRRLDPPTARTD